MKGLRILGFRDWGLEFRVWGLEFRVWGLWFRVWGLGFRVWGSGCRVWGWAMLNAKPPKKGPPLGSDQELIWTPDHMIVAIRDNNYSRVL